MLLIGQTRIAVRKFRLVRKGFLKSESVLVAVELCGEVVDAALHDGGVVTEGIGGNLVEAPAGADRVVAENPRGKQNREDQNRSRRAEEPLFRGPRNEQRNERAWQNPEHVQRPRQRGRGADAGGQKKRKIPVCPEKAEEEEELQRNHRHEHPFGEEHRGECDFGRREHQQERGGQSNPFVFREFQRGLMQNRHRNRGEGAVHENAEQQAVSAHRKRECEKCRIERHAECGRNAGTIRISSSGSGIPRSP